MADMKKALILAACTAGIAAVAALIVKKVRK